MIEHRRYLKPTNYYKEMKEAVNFASPAAFRYLRNIPRDTWRSTRWRQEEMPRRYGIVTSNTSEATNSWLKEARTLTWASALETIVDRMVNRISDCRQKYKVNDFIKRSQEIFDNSTKKARIIITIVQNTGYKH